MQTQVVTIGEGDSLSTAEDIMRLGGVRHMPVVHAGKLVGVLSERDLLRISLSGLSSEANAERRAFLQALQVGRAMSAPPVITEPSAPEAAGDEAAPDERAARLLAERKIGCLPVVDGERVVGIVTATDVLLHFADRDRSGR